MKSNKLSLLSAAKNKSGLKNPFYHKNLRFNMIFYSYQRGYNIRDTLSFYRFKCVQSETICCYVIAFKFICRGWSILICRLLKGAAIIIDTEFNKKESPIWSLKTSFYQMRYGCLYDWSLEREISKPVLELDFTAWHGVPFRIWIPSPMHASLE